MAQANRFIVRMIENILIGKGKKAVQHLDEISEDAVGVSERLLMELIRKNENTEFGKRMHFNEIMSVEDYRKKIPYTDYDFFSEYIDRMVKNGETNLITADPVVQYAMSSGSVGNPKHIPVTQANIDLYTTYTTNMALYCAQEYYRKKGRKFGKTGRGFIALEAVNKPLPDGTPRTAISSTIMKKYEKILKYVYTSPAQVIMPDRMDLDLKYLKLLYLLKDRDCLYLAAAFMTALVDLMSYLEENWLSIVTDIEHGTISASVNIPGNLRGELLSDLKPDPKRAEELRKEFEKGFNDPIIPRILPNVQVIGAIGTGGFAAYTERMKKYSGAIPMHFLTYAASESLMAVARTLNEGEFVLIPDSGFYEFIPIDSADEETSLTMDQLEVGKDYEIVITNLSGLYRYRIKDVIRVTGWHKKAPKLKFVYRKNQMISIAGEKTSQEAVSWVVEQFAKKTGCEIPDYSIYADLSVDPGRYVLLVESYPLLSTEKVKEYEELLNNLFSQANPNLGFVIKNNQLQKPKLKIVQQQTYALYTDMQVMRGTSRNQIKPVRIIDTPAKEKFFFTLTEK